MVSQTTSWLVVRPIEEIIRHYAFEICSYVITCSLGLLVLLNGLEGQVLVGIYQLKP